MALQMKKTSGGTGLAVCARSRVVGFIGKMTGSVIPTKWSVKSSVFKQKVM
jgi:hypothetical protein